MRPMLANNTSQESPKVKNDGFGLGDWKNSLTVTTTVAKMSDSSSQMISKVTLGCPEGRFTGSEELNKYLCWKSLSE